MRWLFLVLLAGLVSTGRIAVAEDRLSDKDIQHLLQNLKHDAQPFRQSFANALKKSRKTGQEKDAKALTETFAKQTQSALDTFKHHHKADPAIAAMVHTAAEIDPLVYSLQPGPQTTGQWEKLRADLHPIAQAYGVTEPYLAPAADAGPPSATGTCLNAVGIERSRQLVNECLQVSPATHPPCNAQNACKLIVDEIKRGCLLIGQDAPGFCAEYR